LKAGTIIRSFMAKDGRRVILRAPQWSDLDDFLKLISALVEEGADINMDAKTTRDAEVDWLARHLSAIEKDGKAAVVAEVDGRAIGQTDVTPKSGRQRHVGVLGIVIRNGYRDIGIGTELMEEAEAQARRLGLKILTLEVFSSNSRARHVYERAGYRIVGRVPKAVLKDGEYVDSIIMTKEI
jgi:RimJ/RimL family protein N-acetyltransferase